LVGGGRLAGAGRRWWGEVGGLGAGDAEPVRPCDAPGAFWCSARVQGGAVGVHEGAVGGAEQPRAVGDLQGQGGWARVLGGDGAGRRVATAAGKLDLGGGGGGRCAG